jgi:hypothetical protein
MIRITINGTSTVLDYLDKVTTGLPGAVEAVTTAVAQVATEGARASIDPHSGRSTGALAASILPAPIEASGLSSRIFVTSDLIYARIQDLGGDIYPKGKANDGSDYLHWINSSGEDAFSRHSHIVAKNYFAKGGEYAYNEIPAIVDEVFTELMA